MIEPGKFLSEALRNKTYDVITLGCKVNTYDTSLLEKRLGNRGLVASDNQAETENLPDIHIINSCAVTERSSLETHRIVKKLKAKNPTSTVVITGCVAQVDVNRLKTLTGADLIVGNSHKGELENILEKYFRGELEDKVFHSNIFKKEDLEEGGGIESSRTRAFLKIQDGCNSFCSFCIIPFARGKSRSIPVDRIVSRVKDLHQQGFQEVILTGVHIGDYEDESKKLSDLVEAILNGSRIPRLRLSSLEPIEMDEKLWTLYASTERLCRHFHVSLQTGNSKVLKEMRRQYGQDEIRGFFERMMQVVPEAYVGMDVIAGFPGESDEDFKDTFEFLSQMPWTRIHVFPYSIRPGTTAAKREDHLQGHVIHERAKRLRALSRARYNQKLQAQVGTVKDVLILEKPSHGANGLSRDYWNVTAMSENGQVLDANREYKVRITGFEPSSPNLEDGILKGCVL